MPAMLKCGGCGKFLPTTTTEAARCKKCNASFHRACVGLALKSIISSSWHCPDCKVKRDNNDDTPVKGPEPIVSELESTSEEDSTCFDILKTTPIQSGSSSVLDVATELRLLRDEMRTFREEHRNDIAELKLSLKACSERMDKLDARVDALEENFLNMPSEPSDLDDIVTQLRSELNDRDQELLANDIEIANLPECNGENTIHITQLIATKLGVTLDERDIVSAERMGGRHINASSNAGSTETRPRPLIVRLSRRSVRNELLKNARVRRGANSADLNMPGSPRRFYVNERLTKFNRQLFRKTRDAGQLHGWKYVWTQRGRILARNKIGDTACPIRSEADLLRIFGPNSGKS